jgi:hypothetical protein
LTEGFESYANKSETPTLWSDVVPTIFYYSQPKGTAAVLVVGGARECIYRDKNEVKLILNSRKGFIKLALRYGRDLVPTFSFGENYIYEQLVSGFDQSQHA